MEYLRGLFWTRLSLVYFLNDLFKLPVSSLLVAYADDLKIVSSDPSSLQKDLLTIEKWCIDNEMIISASKTVVIHFGKSKQKSLYAIFGETIREVAETKDLRILIDRDLTFKLHILSIWKFLLCDFQII